MAQASNLRARITTLQAQFEQSRLGRALTRFTEAEGPVRAKNATYSGFLAFFPVIALGLTAAGYVSGMFENAEEVVIEGIDMFIPGVIGDAEGQISMEAIQRASGAVTFIGLAALAWTGSGWMTATRGGINAVFGLPKAAQPNFVVAKAKDLGLLVVLGLILGGSIAASSMALGYLPGWTRLAGPAIGVISGTAFFAAIYRLVPDARLPWKTVLGGAVLSAIAFELLKFVMVQIVGGVGGSPLASLAIAATVLVWIGFQSQITLIGAAWIVSSEDIDQADVLGFHRHEL